MKIERIDVIPANIPLKKPMEVSFGVWADVTSVITKIYTDEGVVGIGDSEPWAPASRESQETIVGIITKHLAPLLIGEDPFDIEKIWKKMDIAVPGMGMAKAALDLPLYDIMGKALGVPVYKLLGGKSTESIPLTGILGMDNIDKMVEDTLAWVQEGYETVRIKTGRGIGEDVEIMRDIRKAVGNDIKLRIDANQAYTPSEAIQMIRALDEFNIEIVEQPTVWFDFEGLARVTRTVDVPIQPHESLYSIYDAVYLDRMGAGNVYAPKIVRPGGITLAKKMAVYMQLRNIPMFACSACEFAISTAAAAHFAVAFFNGIPFACELSGTSSLTDDIAEPGVVIEKGKATVSDKPGFGVDLDEERLKKYQLDSITIN